MLDVTEINTALYLNSVGLDNVILNDTDTFVDSVGLVDVTKPTLDFVYVVSIFLVSS
jgi:hypothetical protein